MVEHFYHAKLQLFHQRQGEKITNITLLNRKLTKFVFFLVLTGMNFSVTLLTIFSLLRTTIVTSCTASYFLQGQALQNHILKDETADRIVIVSPYALPIRVAIAATFISYRQTM